MKANQLLNTKAGGVIAIASIAAIALYMFNKKLSGAIGEAMQPVTNGFWSLFQDESVELTDFSVSRLHRDFFDNDWVMLPEPKAAFKRAYPDEMSAVLNMHGQLKKQYRDLV